MKETNMKNHVAPSSPRECWERWTCLWEWASGTQLSNGMTTGLHYGYYGNFYHIILIIIDQSRFKPD
jgi:hypothetical protein